MSGKVKAKIIPLGDRSYIIGDSELMGYTGCETLDKLRKYFTARKDGQRLTPDSQIGKTKYYLKSRVDEYIIHVSEWQDVELRTVINQ